MENLKEDQEVQAQLITDPEKEKKRKEKVAKKLIGKAMKKMVQMTQTLPEMEEKSLSEIFTQDHTKDIIILHFGTGSQEEKTCIEELVEDCGISRDQCCINIYPGFFHGHMSFGILEESIKFLSFFEYDVQHQGLSLKTNEVRLHRSYDKTRIMMAGFTSLNKTDMVYNKKFPFSSSCSLFDLQKSEGSANVFLTGVKLIENYLSKEIGKSIIRSLDSITEWGQVSGKRVLNFGFNFTFGKNKIDRESQSHSLPNFLTCHSPLQSLIQKYGYNNIFVQELKSGQGLPPEVFSHSTYGESISVIHLSSGLGNTFISEKGERIELYCGKNSLVTLTGAARYAHYRQIPIRKVDRINDEISFRDRALILVLSRVRDAQQGGFESEYPSLCDSNGYDPALINIPNLVTEVDNKVDTKVIYNDQEEQVLINQAKESVEKEKPTDMEKKYVYEVYEKIADHFSDTRYKAWPQVEHFLKSIPKHSVVCDVGCGNGKYLGVNPDLIMIGTDITHNLLKICNERNQNVFRADGLVLPVKTSSVDYCISIAVIHHFSNPNLRKKALTELLRITKPGGKILVTVWALEQNKKFKTADVFVPWNLNKVYHSNNQTKGLEKKTEEIVEAKATDDCRPEIFRDEQKNAVVYKRYYHLFVYKELESLLEEIEGVKIQDSFYDRDNWCVIFEKSVQS